MKTFLPNPFIDSLESSRDIHLKNGLCLFIIKFINLISSSYKFVPGYALWQVTNLYWMGSRGVFVCVADDAKQATLYCHHHRFVRRV